MDNPAVSVLIPAYNREEFIEECLWSVSMQSYENVHLIVYDDGSTDDTAGIARKFPTADVNLGGLNKGISYARNRLLEHCQSPYATWQDSDDISNIYRIEEQVRLILKTMVPIVYCHYRREKGGISNAWQLEPISGSGFPSHCLGGSLFDVSLAKQIPFDERLTAGEDVIWRMTLEKKFGEGKVVNKLLYHYRIHPQRTTSLKHLPEHRERERLNGQIYAEALKNISNQ